MSEEPTYPVVPSSDKLAGLFRALLAASGPFAALILQKTGWSSADYALYVEAFIAVVPILVSGAWSWWAKRDAAKLIAASKVKGAVVVTTDLAAPKLKKIAEASTNPDVITQDEFLERVTEEGR